MLLFVELAKDFIRGRAKRIEEGTSFIDIFLAPPKTEAEMEELERSGRADEFLEKTRGETGEVKGGVTTKRTYGGKLIDVVIA